MTLNPPCSFRLLFFLILSCVTTRLQPASAAETPTPWEVIVVGEQTESERLATVDLRRFLAEVTRKMPKMMTVAEWEKAPASAVILGTLESNSLLPAAAAFKPDALGEEGYGLENATVKAQPVVLAAGATPAGAVNAVYGLLRELHFGFYLGSQSIPTKLPATLGTSPVVQKPALKIRGVLPWYNFLNSPTTWEIEDHRAFADQLIRMGANFVGFHTYDNEPFASYEEDGKMKMGERLLNTSAALWGTVPMATKDFGGGTGALFPEPYFGAASTFAKVDRNAAIKLEQNIMQEALAYASSRGLKTCLGFEINGDPTNPQDRDIFLKRLNHVLDQHPKLDFIWIWQPETQGAQGYSTQYNLHGFRHHLDLSSPLLRYGAARRPMFKRVVEDAKGLPPFFQDTEKGKAARAVEGARLEQFARLALNAIARRTHQPRLAVSGWGGEDRIMSAEYYDGLDQLLPKEVVFTSLDFPNPRETVDSIYGALPADRERWPIPWLELDGDQWQPQPWVRVYEKMMEAIQKGGSQGVLGIHWRTRDLDENFAFLVRAAWQPGLKAAAFFDDLALHKYPPSIVPEMARIHRELDQLGYRWVGGTGQNECAPFTWGAGEPAKIAALESLRDASVAQLRKADGSTANLDYLIACMNWTLAYTRAEQDAMKVRSIFDNVAGAETQTGWAQGTSKARSLLERANTLTAEQKAGIGKELFDILDEDRLTLALHAYVNRLTTRGEYGVLATVNAKAYADWREMESNARQMAGITETPAPKQWSPEPKILLPRFYGSTPAGRPLELQPVVLGGGAAWAHYRPVGSETWRSQRLQPLAGWVQKAVIPAGDISEPGLEMGFSFESDPEKPMSFRPVGISVLRLSAPPSSNLEVKAATDLTLTVTVLPDPVARFALKWKEVPSANFYKVMRDGKLIVETAVAYFPEFDAHTDAASYIVEAWGDGARIAASAPVTPDAVARNDVAPTLKQLRASFLRPTRFAEVDGIAKFAPLKPLTTWVARDGVTKINNTMVDGNATIQLQIGDGQTPGYNHSVRVSDDPIDLTGTPILHFRIRTQETEPLAILIQMEGEENWHALNVVGTQGKYTEADTLPEINDGQWHRVSWDLAKLVDEVIKPPRADGRIGAIIFGSWETPTKPLQVEIQSAALGR